MQGMIIFGIVQLITVILGTLRSICTIKANKHIGMLANVASFTFAALVVKLTGGQALWYVITITAITNAIGFYIGNGIFTAFQKDKLWRISATVTNETVGQAVADNLMNYGLTFNDNKISNHTTIFDIFSKTRAESGLIKEILTEFNVKYHVIEIDKKL